MKREFSQHIQIMVPVSSGGIFVDLYTSDEVIFEEDAKLTSHGVIYEQSLEVVVDRSDCRILSAYASRFNALVKLNDGVDSYLWGSADIPVKVVIEPKLESCLILLSRDSIKALIAL